MVSFIAIFILQPLITYRYISKIRAGNRDLLYRLLPIPAIFMPTYFYNNRAFNHHSADMHAKYLSSLSDSEMDNLDQMYQEAKRQL